MKFKISNSIGDSDVIEALDFCWALALARCKWPLCKQWSAEAA